MMQNDALLRRLDVAKRFKVSPRTLDYWVHNRSVPFVKIGNTIRFIPADIEKFIETHRVQGIILHRRSRR